MRIKIKRSGIKANDKYYDKMKNKTLKEYEEEEQNDERKKRIPKV